MKLWGSAKPRHRQHLPDGRDVAVYAGLAVSWAVIIVVLIWAGVR